MTDGATGLDTWSRLFYLVHGPITALTCEYIILIPIVISVCLSFYGGEDFEFGIFYASIASVLSGAVLGDHCSTIPDTTVLSSMATGCNHINHVNSQLTYCLVSGGVAVFLILLHSMFNINIGIVYTIGVVLIWLIIKLLGSLKFNTTGK